MSDPRKLLEELYDTAHAEAIEADGKNRPDVVVVCQTIGRIVDRVMAEYPRVEAGKVPDLPDYVRDLGTGYYDVSLPSGDVFVTEANEPDDLDRIAEACRILAARRRAGL